MKHGIFSFLKGSLKTSALWAVAALAAGATLASAAPATELRLLTHSSFAIPKPLLAQFEKDAGVKLRITKAGDAGEMLNKLILTKANPIADVVYGIDNALAPKAFAADVLAPYDGPAASKAIKLGNIGRGNLLISVDYGYVMLNYDKAWFAKRALALPKTLEELTQPAYAKLMVTENPATSSPGYAFMLATIGAIGEEKAFDWWSRMRTNGLKVSKGWSEAYYTEFSRNGGKYPIVVSYASSPAAELFYAKDKPTEPPTAALPLAGGVYRQIEGVALVKGGAHTEAAGKFIEFLRSTPVQQQMQTEMWMYPADESVARADVMKFAPEPTAFDNPNDKDVADKGALWVQRWTKAVLK